MAETAARGRYMARRKWTRSTAEDYLRTNANWLDIQMDLAHPTDLSSLKASQVIRYARNFYTANELDGREFETLAEARGHGAGEHHKGRAQKRSANYEKPYRIPRGRFNQPIAETVNKPPGVWRTPGHPPRVHAGYVRNTSGEGMAKRELEFAAQRKATVYITVYGPRGDAKTLFSKSGYRADLLLEAAGYTQRGHTGHWRLSGFRTAKRQHQGLEEYLLNIVNNLPEKSQPEDPWGRIRFYQIIVDEEAVPVRLRRKRDPWPSPEAKRAAGFQAGLLVQSVPTKSVRKQRNRAKRPSPNVRANTKVTK